LAIHDDKIAVGHLADKRWLFPGYEKQPVQNGPGHHYRSRISLLQDFVEFVHQRDPFRLQSGLRKLAQGLANFGEMIEETADSAKTLKP
jgi:hypothetical protein